MPAMLPVLVANVGRRMKPQYKPQERKVAGKTGTVHRQQGDRYGTDTDVLLFHAVTNLVL